MRFADEEYYHVYNRGAHKAPIFFSPANYTYLVSLFRKHAPRLGVRVVAYCFLPNHYHLVLRQERQGSISKFLQTVFNAFVQAANLQRKHSGTLFEARSKAKRVHSDEYALQLIRYIHMNPVNAHLVERPEAWEFSDFSVWCGLREPAITDLTLRNTFFKDGEDYRQFALAHGVEEPSEGLSRENLRKDQADPSRPSESRLYLVATPIGNLEDITYRAVRVLSSVDLIAAEDTRKTKILLDHYGITKPMVSYHSYNERRRAPELLQKLLTGQSIAVVSDAGTPGISDPAFYLVREALSHSIPIVPIPGAAAFISALVVSGLPTDRFVFEGFLPQKKGRKTKLETLRSETRTIILYESPHRVLKTLAEIQSYWGDRHVVVARELTKKFEEIVRGPVTSVLNELSRKPPRGEYVLIIAGQKSP